MRMSLLRQAFDVAAISKRIRKIRERLAKRSGHKGVTRPLSIPDNQVEVTSDQCPDCEAKFNPPFRFKSKVIEEILGPQLVIVTEYKITH